MHALPKGSEPCNHPTSQALPKLFRSMVALTAQHTSDSQHPFPQPILPPLVFHRAPKLRNDLRVHDDEAQYGPLGWCLMRRIPHNSQNCCPCTICQDERPQGQGSSPPLGPTSQTLPRSLRSRSTIMRFSARSFSEAARSAAAAASAAGSSLRGAVPLMGRASSSPEMLPRRKRSGEEQHTCSGSGSGNGMTLGV